MQPRCQSNYDWPSWRYFGCTSQCNFVPSNGELAYNRVEQAPVSLCCRECACPPFARETHPVAGLTERSMLEGAGAFFVSHSSYPRCPWRSYKELRLLLIFRMGGALMIWIFTLALICSTTLGNFLAQQHYDIMVLDGPSHAENTRPCLCPYMSLDCF